MTDLAMPDLLSDDVRTARSERPALQIDIVSDVVCPWCYVGKRNLEAALAHMPDVAAQVHWRPYQLDPTIPREGLDRKAYMARKFGDRVDEIQNRIRETARSSGLALNFEAIVRSPNTLDAHRLIRWAWSAGRQDAIVESLFEAFFLEGLDIGDHDVLARRAAEVGMDSTIVRSLLAGSDDVDSVQAEISQARELGVTGVPFFILDQKIGVSGAQPPDVLVRMIERALVRED